MTPTRYPRLTGVRSLVAVVALLALPTVAVVSSVTAAGSRLDDRDLSVVTGPWSNDSSARADDGTLRCSSSRGATLELPRPTTYGGQVRVQLGRGRGSLVVVVDGTPRSLIPTAGPTGDFAEVSFASAGEVRLRVTTSGKKVCIDSVTIAGAPPAKADGAMRQVDRNDNGRTPNAPVLSAALSPGGTMVAFWSKATNLWPGVADGRQHLYISSVASGRVIGVADRDSNGAIASDSTTSDDQNAITWGPIDPSTGDATKIAFASSSETIAPVLNSGLYPHLYMKDIVTGEATWLLAGVKEAHWAPRGPRIAVVTNQYVTYGNAPVATEVVWIVNTALDSLDNDYLTPVSTTNAGQWPGQYAHSNQAQWSPNGDRILFTSFGALVPSDTNGASDVYMRTLATGAITRVSVGDAATKNRAQGNDFSRDGTWSPDGSWIAFASQATNLVRGDSDGAQSVFVRDLASGEVVLASTTSDGRPQSSYLASYRPVFSPDGSRIAFMSLASNLLPSPLTVEPPSGSTIYAHVYVKWLSTGRVQIASTNGSGRYSNGESDIYAGASQDPMWLPDSSGLMMLSRGTNLSAADSNYMWNVYIKYF